jgi:hypothetical protein
MSGTFYGVSQLTLVFGTGASLSTRPDFAIFVNKTAK